MNDFGDLESVLIVFQNPVEGRMEPYDDWYTHVHIRDALRLEGALATQRFIAAEKPLVHAGREHRPSHWAHTIYEWESAQASVEGHAHRGGTPEMEISNYGDFNGLRDFYFRPVHLSRGWSLDEGFRPGGRNILTAMINPESDPAEFEAWFRECYTDDVPGVGSVALFSLHEAQSLPDPSPFSHAVIHSLTDADRALAAWAAEGSAAAGLQSIVDRAKDIELTHWQPRIERLLARDVLDPSASAASEEVRARAQHRESYCSRQEILQFLGS